MANEQFSVRIQKYSPQEIEDKAASYNMNRNTFVNAAVNILMDMSPDTYKDIQSFADALKIPVGVVVSSVFTDRKARAAAEEKAYGRQKQEVLGEFMFTNSGPIIDEALFKIRYDHYLNRFTQERMAAIQSRIDKGLKLHESDIEFMAIQEYKQQRFQPHTEEEIQRGLAEVEAEEASKRIDQLSNECLDIIEKKRGK